MDGISYMDQCEHDLNRLASLPDETILQLNAKSHKKYKNALNTIIMYNDNIDIVRSAARELGRLSAAIMAHLNDEKNAWEGTCIQLKKLVAKKLNMPTSKIDTEVKLVKKETEVCRLKNQITKLEKELTQYRNQNELDNQLDALISS